VTTIRAHPPVETPAGLVVALPPEFSGEGVGSKIGETDSNRPTAGRNAGTDPTVPDVFALAVPCPTCDGKGVRLDPSHVARAFFAVLDHGSGAGVKHLTCRECEGSGWVHHGDYRVLSVHSVERSPLAGVPFVSLATGNTLDISNVPGAVPGGVALVVEWVPR
jgi:hypothetical protein